MAARVAAAMMVARNAGRVGMGTVGAAAADAAAARVAAKAAARVVAAEAKVGVGVARVAARGTGSKEEATRASVVPLSTA